MVSLNYPECRAKEVDSGTPRAVYACGSSDYAQLGGTFEKSFDRFYGLSITNEKERSKWMDERMAKGYSFLYFKNEKRENVGVFCVETQEEFNYIFEGAKNTEEQVQADSHKKEENMANWGIASTAPEIEKIKSVMADYLHGLNSCAEIDYSIYSQLFDFSLPLIQKAYELGKKEAQQVIQPNLHTKDDMQNQQWCMCVKLKDVARDGKSTCSICGGRDAYGLSTERPEDKKKTITTT